MLPRITNILLATDLSSNSDNAMRFAVSLAEAHDANVHVLHVLEPLSQDAVVTLQVFMLNEESRQKAIKERHASVKNLLKENQQKFVGSLDDDEKSHYRRVESVELVEGHLAEEILARANNLGCELIVMGTHEQETGHTFIGTVVKRVLRRSSIPTLIVPPTA